MSFDRKVAGKTEWYRQAAGVRPLSLSYPWFTCIAMTVRGRKIRPWYQDHYGYFYDDFVFIYFARPLMDWVGGYYVRRQQRDPQFIQALKKRWDINERKKFVHAVRQLEKMDFSELSLPQLYQKFVVFSKIYIRMWQECIFHDVFDVIGERLIDDCLAHEGVTIPHDDVLALLATDHPSEFQQEQFALANLACEAQKNKTPKFYKKIVQHATKYHWIRNDYVRVLHLSEEHFLQEIEGLLAKPEQLAHTAAAKRAFSVRQRTKQALFRKYKLSSTTRNIFNVLATVSLWRDDRKACNQRGSAIVKKFIMTLARRTKILPEDLGYALWWEHELLFKPTFAYKRLLKNRRTKGFGLRLQRDGKVEELVGVPGKSFSIFLDKLINGKELRGRSAYPGVVRGTVKMILDTRDFSKLKPGDILVAPNTRPEYVPIMKLAGAIISEEGGITCHSAIVSRELHKPCVVGVQGVIAALKDGDRVEVDAVKGVVKKI